MFSLFYRLRQEGGGESECEGLGGMRWEAREDIRLV
jgi:hypothetical protein